MFEVRVNGETVYKTEYQVTGVSLMSARGELYRAGISTEGVVDLVLETVQAGAPVRLDQLEAAQRAARAAFVQDHRSGNPPYQVARDMNAQQGSQDYTTREGGPMPLEEQQAAVPGPPPAVDLAAGLSPGDTETLTKRIEAFSEHGDAYRAVSDNPPSGQVTTAEQGAVPTAGQPETQIAGQVGTTGGTPGTSSQFQLGPTINEGSPAGQPPPESTPEGNIGAQPQGVGAGGPAVSSGGFAPAPGTEPVTGVGQPPESEAGLSPNEPAPAPPSGA